MINVENINRFSIPIEKDYHTLSQSEVERVICAANSDGYRKPKNANGSRARYYFAALKRKYNALKAVL